jgi:hypothetical protein
MKNLGGNNVSIFLFRFELRNNAISFVLNESIAEDMYPEIDEQIQPLFQACGETLMRYKKLCCGETIIMDGNILVDGCFEVMLSKGLGKHFAEREKQNLFNDANEIANLLMDVMDRRTKELKQGAYPGPQPVISKIQRTGVTNKGLEALGQKQQLEKLPWYASEKPGLNKLKPDDLPDGVVAKRGYDHRGHCITFEHETLGELGKIILTDVEEDKLLMEAELSREKPETLGKKKKVLEEIISIIEAALRNTPEQENT